MDLDTPNKRRSMMASGLQSLTVYPVPDGTDSALKRRHDTAIYAGVGGGEPPPPIEGGDAYRERRYPIELRSRVV
jgi:hypothetical protein